MVYSVANLLRFVTLRPVNFLFPRLATSRPWGREGAGKGTRDPSDEVASGRLVSLAGI